MDRITKKQRRRNMQAVKSRDSKIEKKLARALQIKGYRFKRNYSKVTGKPDIVFPCLKVAVFCDSEFWHGKNWCVKKREIKTNREFWYPKIERNIARDRQVNSLLKRADWKVLRFWGKNIEKNTDKCVRAIEKTVRKIQDARSIGSKNKMRR